MNRRSSILQPPPHDPPLTRKRSPSLPASSLLANSRAIEDAERLVPLTAQQLTVRLLSELHLPPPASAGEFPYLHNVIPWVHADRRATPAPPPPCTILLHADPNFRFRGSVAPEDVLLQDPGNLRWRWSLFLLPPPKRTIRNFALQPQIICRFADVVVYGSDGVSDRVRQVADAVYQAQTFCALSWGLPQRKVYILTDTFEQVSILAPDLVEYCPYMPVPSAVLDFQARETREALEVAKAMEILPNIWIGANEDLHWSPPDWGAEEGRAFFDVCVHTTGAMEDARRANGLQPLSSEDSAIISPTTTASAASTALHETIHLQAPAASHSHPDDAPAILNLCRCVAALAREGHHTLLHSADGWLEPTVMVLGVIMWHERCGLARACVILWKKRAFYLGQLRAACEALEEAVWACIEEEAEEASLRAAKRDEKPHHKSKSRHRSKRMSVGTLPLDDGDRRGRRKSLARRASLGAGGYFVDPTASSPAIMNFPPATHTDQDNRSLTTLEPTEEDIIMGKAPGDDGSIKLVVTGHPLPPSPDPNPSSALVPAASQEASTPLAWFYRPTFDDTFPSRILPFMYLGDLRQAADADMLYDLGITHILSVGITIKHPHQGIPVRVLEKLNDDGVDPLLPGLPDALDYIDRVAAEGGRVLVHCQVGTSRSASVCIAYMMEHRDMSLVDAYMWVRARRIAVIIQPNLRFMWELWEREIACLPPRGSPHYLTRLRERLGWLEWCKGITLLNDQP